MVSWRLSGGFPSAFQGNTASFLASECGWSAAGFLAGKPPACRQRSARVPRSSASLTTITVRLVLLLVEVAEARTIAETVERRWNYMESSAPFPGFSLGNPAAFPRISVGKLVAFPRVSNGKLVAFTGNAGGKPPESWQHSLGKPAVSW